MSQALLRLGDNFNSYINGEVIIHPTAVIAPGVILQAANNSKIVIGAGVCIGMGSIIQVNEGIIEIEAGANLGSGFLMVGAGKIGSNACIGAATTVFNCSIASGQVIAPGSIVGDKSRENAIIMVTETPPSDDIPDSTDSPESQVEEQIKTEIKEQIEEQPQETVTSTTEFIAGGFMRFKSKSTTVSTPSPTPKSQSPPLEDNPNQTNDSPSEQNIPQEIETTTAELETQESVAKTIGSLGTQIYGKSSINRLLITLFPHRQSLSEEDES
ncbi:transferase [Anabaena sp. FACHB-1237]|uniref:transferase n=1 Tax=Anabaena sp. FACHB-1237 TaxID=2692769 RepID=UPI001681B44A|nr:transferase [Anabaena sp. FACHB-1237]MBD2139045.1 transferase [Anabaena sp. FACHB-1237]